MIQELFGGAGLLGGGERKFSFHGGILEGLPSSSSPSPSLSPSPSPSHPTTATSNTTSASATSTTTTSAAINTSTSSDQQNLRCPRCDSPNTKFCYYNNYNLTQPRHFCKTCRRYWTKGGALRNVPIGGGCRKNKNIITTVPTIAGKSSVAGKVKSSDFKSNLGNGFDHHHHQQQSSNPILWPSQHNPHQLLALLRASSQNPNPNCVKTEGGMIGSHMGSEASVVTSALNARNLNIDHHLGQVPIGLCSSTTSSAFWRNNNNQHHQNGLLFQGEVQQQNSNGMQDLYQRLRSSSAANYYSSTNDHTQQAGHVMNNAVSTSSASLSILDSAPVAGGEMGGYWNNPQFSWTDLSATTNGAFP